MNIHAVICTRSREEVTPTTNKLVKFLVSCGIKVYVIDKATSIFDAYQGAFNKISPPDEDIMIFCHDDIDIREDPGVFVDKLKHEFQYSNVGFVGPAGTSHLGVEAVWWDADLWKKGKHKGKVIHMNPQGEEYLTTYGDPGSVVTLDGLFLAAKPALIKEIGLLKPSYFSGEWDFYDLHYTSKAFGLGYDNRVFDINIMHNSRGELVGRDSWHANRLSFIANNELPLKLNP